MARKIPCRSFEVAKFYEVQKYLTLDGHVYSILPILINDNSTLPFPPISGASSGTAATSWPELRGRGTSAMFSTGSNPAGQGNDRVHAHGE